jgi:hypothetical protein
MITRVDVSASMGLSGCNSTIFGCESSHARLLKLMGHNRGRDNVRKRAVRRKKTERLATAKKNKAPTLPRKQHPTTGEKDRS